MPPRSPSPKRRDVNRLPSAHKSQPPRCCCFIPRPRSQATSGSRRASKMSILASRVGSDYMAPLATTREPPSDGSAVRLRPKKSSSDARVQLYPTAARSPHVDDRDAATDAVATAFARIVAERYPGTSWLPVKSSRSDDRFVVPAGKVLRLLPGPADMDTDRGIGHPAAPTTH